MTFMSKIIMFIGGEFARVVNNGKGKVLVAHFPNSSVERKRVEIAISGSPSFLIRRADPEDLDCGPWILGASTESENHAMSTRARELILADKSSSDDAIYRLPFRIASFNNKIDADHALNLVNDALRRDARITKSEESNPGASGGSTNHGFLNFIWQAMKYALICTFLGASTLVLTGFLIIHHRGPSPSIASLQVLQPGKSTAIHYGPDTNLKTLYVFSDPSCSDCKKMQETISELAGRGVDIWVFPLSVMKGSDDKVRAAICAKDPAKAWSKLVQENTAPDTNLHCSAEKAGEVNLELFNAFNLQDAPTTVLSNGVIVANYRSADEITKMLQL